MKIEVHRIGIRGLFRPARLSADELKGYGTIAGTRRSDNPRLIDVSLIIEKPDVATARARLLPEFSCDRMTARYLALYRELVTTAARATHRRSKASEVDVELQ